MSKALPRGGLRVGVTFRSEVPRVVCIEVCVWARLLGRLWERDGGVVAA